MTDDVGANSDGGRAAADSGYSGVGIAEDGEDGAYDMPDGVDHGGKPLIQQADADTHAGPSPGGRGSGWVWE